MRGTLAMIFGKVQYHAKILCDLVLPPAVNHNDQSLSVSSFLHEHTDTHLQELVPRSTIVKIFESKSCKRTSWLFKNHEECIFDNRLLKK